MGNWNRDLAIRGALRRVFSRSPVVREVLAKVRREVPRYNQDGSRSKRNSVQYLCNVCKNWVGSTKISVDHIEPVIAVDVGFVDFNTFIDRLFCSAENLQAICDECHQAKTNAERIERLTRQYAAELDSLEDRLRSGSITTKDAKRALRKYLAKKASGLEAISARARLLMDTLDGT